VGSRPPINVLDPTFYVDPWDAYRWMRENQPVFWDPVQRVWALTRYDDVLHVEKTPARYSSFAGSRPRLDQRADGSMINLDDPEHQAQRRLVSRRFTPRAVRSHEHAVRALADRIIDDLGGSGEVEIVEQVASRLPAMVIAELLGYPFELWPLIREVSEVTMLAAGQTKADGSEPEFDHAGAEVTLRWRDVTLELIEARRARPADDLISLWVNTETGGELWSDQRVIEECILVLDGGAETTRTVVGAICFELAARPEVQRLLREQPALLESTAVEEFIRWVTPIVNMRRTVTEPHELRGCELAAGDEVVLLYAAANRDERAFPEPDAFDVLRTPNHHVAFGFGTHVCLGAPLARLELRVLFEQLLSRLPAWRLVPGTSPEVVPSTFTRAYDEVHIEF
jgi:cholest-4-en-3-one 26-monooxygenase